MGLIPVFTHGHPGSPSSVMVTMCPERFLMSFVLCDKFEEVTLTVCNLLLLFASFVFSHVLNNHPSEWLSGGLQRMSWMVHSNSQYNNKWNRSPPPSTSKILNFSLFAHFEKCQFVASFLHCCVMCSGCGSLVLSSGTDDWISLKRNASSCNNWTGSLIS